MPIGGRGLDALEILPRYRQMAAEAGRNPDDVPMSVFAARQDADQLKRYGDAGVDRAVFLLPTGASGGTTQFSASTVYCRTILMTLLRCGFS
jgi:hypothetical protein